MWLVDLWTACSPKFNRPSGLWICAARRVALSPDSHVWASNWRTGSRQLGDPRVLSHELGEWDRSLMVRVWTSVGACKRSYLRLGSTYDVVRIR